MPRPFGSRSRGFVSQFLRRAEELTRMSDSCEDLSNLKRSVRSFEKLLQKALRMANPADTNSLQRLASGISALAKAHSVIEKRQVATRRTWEVLP